MSRRRKSKPNTPPSGLTAVHDAFANPLFRLGYGSQSPLEATEYPSARLTGNYALMNSLYRDNWVVQNVVGIIPDDMTKEWFTPTGSVTPRQLEELGIRCRMYAPLRPLVSTHYNNRDHRKIMVIDGRAAFTGGERTDQVLADFTAPEDGLLHILCLHGDVSGPASRYGPVTREQIGLCGADYLALGHIHQGSGLNKEGNTFWAYPGCPEGRGFDELGDKGVLYVEAEPGQVKSQFVSLAKRRYEIITADITGPAGPLAALLEALPGRTSDLICRLILTGEGPAPDLVNLEQTLAPEFYGLTLVDRTRLPRDLWARREEDTLTGLFLRTMWEKCQAEPDNQALQLAARYGLAALEGGEEL